MLNSPKNPRRARTRVVFDPRLLVVPSAEDELRDLPLRVPAARVCTLLDISKRTLLRLVGSGALLPWKITPSRGAHLHITRDSLIAYARRAGVAC